MNAVLFALITYFGWGIGDVFATSATRKMGAFSETLWSGAISVLLFTLYIPFVAPPHFSFPTFLLNLFIGVIFIISYFAFTKGTQIGNAALTGTMVSCFPAISIIISSVLFKEQISQAQLIGIIIIFLGLLLSLLEIKEIRKGNYIKDPAIPLGAIAMVTAGVYFSLIKIPIKETGWFWPTYTTFSLLFIVFLGIKLFKKIPVSSIRRKKVFIPLLVSIITLRSGDFAYNIAISQGLTAIVAPIASSAVTLFAPLAYVFFRDAITKQQVAGLVITIIGIVMLSFSSI